MTYSHPLHVARFEHLDRLLVPAAVATTVASIALTALGIWGDGSPGADPSVADFLFVSATTLVAAALVFGLLLPRVMHHPSAGVVAAGLGVVALAAAALFWLGIAGVLGVGAVLLGLENRDAARGAGAAKAGAVLGALAVVAYVAMYALDWMSTNDII